MQLGNMHLLCPTDRSAKVTEAAEKLSPGAL